MTTLFDPMGFTMAAATPAPSGSSTTTVLIAVLSSGAFFAVVGAIVTGLFSRKKLGAEATEIITKAASGVVSDLRAELTRVQEAGALALEEQKGKYEAAIATLMADHAAEMEDVRRTLQLHVAWDTLAVTKLKELGIDLPPVPPLLPPSTTHSLHL